VVKNTRTHSPPRLNSLHSFSRKNLTGQAEKHGTTQTRRRTNSYAAQGNTEDARNWILFLKIFVDRIYRIVRILFPQVFRPPAHRAYSPAGRKPGNPIAFGEGGNVIASRIIVLNFQQSMLTMVSS